MPLGWAAQVNRFKLSPMRPSEALTLHRAQIREIALRHPMRDVRVVGFALQCDDTPNSLPASFRGHVLGEAKAV